MSMTCTFVRRLSLNVARKCERCKDMGVACERSAQFPSCKRCRRQKKKCVPPDTQIEGGDRKGGKNQAAVASTSKTKDDLKTCEGHTVIKAINDLRAKFEQAALDPVGIEDTLQSIVRSQKRILHMLERLTESVEALAKGVENLEGRE